METTQDLALQLQNTHISGCEDNKIILKYGKMYKLELRWDDSNSDREVLTMLFFAYDYLKKIFNRNCILLENVSERKTVPLDDVAIYKYPSINLIFNKDEYPSEVKDEDHVILTINANKELIRTNKNGTSKVIAFNLTRTGYAKIANLVEMPNESDIPQYEKSDYQQNQLDVTTNPQSKVGNRAAYQNTQKYQESLQNDNNKQKKSKASQFKRDTNENQDSINSQKQSQIQQDTQKKSSKTKTNHVQDKSQQHFYTMDEVQRHNTKDSAWSVINGIVYDFTQFLHKHPGGFNNIFRAIGKDGTNDFVDGHSYVSNSRKFLAQYEIGTLKRQ